MRVVIVFIVFFLSLDSAIAKDYYWIGDSGDWSDINHWVTTSGGNTPHTQTPTAGDNVIFDANSFNSPGQIVTISSAIAFCQNLDFRTVTFNPTFSSNNATSLSVFGNVYLVSDMTFDFKGSMTLSSDQRDNELDFSRHKLGSNLTFDGGGSWNVISNLYVDVLIEFKRGDVFFLGDIVRTQFLLSNSNSNRRIDLGNTNFRLTGATNAPTLNSDPVNQYTAQFGGSSFILSGGASNLIFESDQASIFTDGQGELTLNDVTLENTTGSFNLYNVRNQTIINIRGTADLRHSAMLQSSMSIDSLILYPAQSYILGAGLFYNIKYIDARGSCKESIILRSTESNSAAIINAQQNIQVEYVTLSDIHINSGLAEAINSIDLGNNTGWTIDMDNSLDFYWVGGSGDWDNPDHWSLISGGPSSDCIPSSADNVIFDEASFSANDQTVYINVPNATCNNMIWQNLSSQARLAGNDASTITIHGSLSFDDNMIHDFSGDYLFVASDADNTIKTAGHIFNRDVFFNNASGVWTLLDEFVLKNNLLFQNGSLNTNGQYVEMYSFNSDYDTPRSLTLGASEIKLLQKGGNLITWVTNSTNLNLDAGTSNISLDGAFASLTNKGSKTINYNKVTFEGIRGFIRTQNTIGSEPIFNEVQFNKDGNIEGSNDINTLRLNNGFSYFLQNNAIQEVDNLEWGDECDGLVTITNFSFSDDPVNIKLNITDTIESFSLRGVNFISSNVIYALNSIDGGANQNVNFDPPMSRDLFWIGGSGDWSDPDHWSGTSGGPGGECAPTQLDNVHFDNFSFNNPNDQITNTNGSSGYCNNFSFNAPGSDVSLTLQALYLYGNLDIQSPLNLNTTLEILSYNKDQLIATSGNTITTVIIRGDKSVTLMDDLNISNFFRIEGSLTFDLSGFEVSTQEMNIQSFADARPTLLLDNSKIIINGSSRSFSQPLTITGNLDPIISSNNSIIEFTNEMTGVQIAIPIELGTLYFSNPTGTSIINLTDSPSINKVVFNNDGVIRGSSHLTVDSLFLSSGQSYTFEADQTQVINSYLKALGNNCTPIEWLSNSSGLKASILMNEPATIEMDFVELKDIQAIGTADFNAGSHSTNITNSNIGWYFPEPTESDQEGFLGPDQIICDNSSFSLSPFTSGEMLNLEWSNGSTEITQILTENTTLGARVTFANNCSLEDSIIIQFDPEFDVNIGNDTTLCENETLTLSLNIPSEDLSSVLWQNDIPTPEHTISDSGTYYVMVTKGACKATDTINVRYQAAIQPQLEDSIKACKGDTITLDPLVPNAIYTWSDMSTEPTLSINSSGTFSVYIEQGACQTFDSTVVTINELPMIELGKDTLICESTPLILSSTNMSSVDFLWNTGATTREISVDSSADYILTVTDQNLCEQKDTINVEIAPLPMFTMSSDTSVCFGESLVIGINNNYSSYLWNNGSTDRAITISEPGYYTLTTQEGICSFKDSILLSLEELPEINLGVDTTICEGDILTLNVEVENSSYQWSNGLTAPSNTIANGTLSVIVDRNGCKYTDEITVDTKPIPSFSLGEDKLLCQGDSLRIIPDVEDSWSVTWNTGQTTKNLIVTEDRTYIATAMDQGCSFSDSIDVEFLPEPIFSLGADSTKCEVNAIELEIPLGEEIDIVWQDGSIGNSYTVEFEGLYRATAMNIAGCVYEDEVYITDEECNRFKLYMPNIFTPNNDGIHDEFKVVVPATVEVAEFEMNVYDRWGGLMYSSKDINQSWDGTINGSPVGTGSYAVAVQIRYTDDYDYLKLDNIYGSVLISR